MIRLCTRALLVVLVSLGTLVSSSLGGNVLCFGADGHAALEPSHKQGASAPHVSGAGGGPASFDRNHGPCSDVGANVEVAVRRSVADAATMQHALTGPLLHLATPCPAADLAARSLPTAGTSSPAPITGAAHLRSVVLLI